VGETRILREEREYEDRARRDGDRKAGIEMG